MSDDGANSRFVLDLPDPEAALALAGEAESTLHRLGALTGASLVLRGLQLVITGRSLQIERAAAVVELVRPIWQEGQSLSAVDLQSALGALNTGRGEDHAAMGEQVLQELSRRSRSTSRKHTGSKISAKLAGYLGLSE